MRSGSTSSSRRIRADAEHAVLRVQRDVDAGRDVVGDQRRHADAEVDVVAVLQLAGDAPDDAFADIHGQSRIDLRFVSLSSPSASRSASRSASPWRMCCTKMPGVTTWSGSIAPGSTSCSTSAIVTRGGGRHHRVEIARRPAVDEIADAVALPRLARTRSRRASGGSSTYGLPSMTPRLLALGDERAVAGRREEAADAGAAGANPLGERALRHELDLELAAQELALELLVLADVGRDHLPDLPRLEQDADAEIVDAGVVADDGQVASCRGRAAPRSGSRECRRDRSRPS